MDAPRFLLALLLFGSSVAVHANWGSTAGGSVATGCFHAFGTDQVEMQREDLRIRLYRDRAKVEVDYIIRNTGPAVDVRAGFPSLGIQLEDVPHQEIKHYALDADGQHVAFSTESGDPAPFKRLFDAKFRQMGELDEYPPEKRPELLEWFVSTVHFDPEQSRRIHISYDSLYACCGGGYSDDSEDCDDRFAYVLSTAAAWKGPIAEGHVSIEAVAAIGDVQVRNIDCELLQEVVSNWTCNPKTIKNRVGTFRLIWDKAKAWKYTADTAYDGLSLPEWEKEEQPCFSVEEIAQIIERSPQPYNTVWRLVAETGIRRGEICGLNVGDVHVNRCIIVVQRSRTNPPRRTASCHGHR